jgi:hypothetical protein
MRYPVLKVSVVQLEMAKFTKGSHLCKKRGKIMLKKRGEGSMRRNIE